MQVNSGMLFSVIARDGTDAEAPARRQAARDQHLTELQPHVDSGVIQFGGAFLDETGTMRGSILVLDLPDRPAVSEWLNNDIYTRSGVWQDFEVAEFRRAV